MDFDQLLELAQLGAIPMLTVAVVALWRRLNVVQDRFVSYLEDSARRGDVAAQKALNGNARTPERTP